VQKYKHLIVSPHYTRARFEKLIDQEIAAAQAGKPAFIKIKMNSFTSYYMVDKLYEASRAGVQVQLIVRGICCLIPGVPGMSENIEAISIVDKFLEHPRIFIFGNQNNPLVFISSADWMTRNIENRVEVTCPIYDEDIKAELMDIFDIYKKANTKARILNQAQDNQYKKNNLPPFRAQFQTYEYYINKLKN
jgi:polyphosphate kinase